MAENMDTVDRMLAQFERGQVPAAQREQVGKSFLGVPEGFTARRNVGVKGTPEEGLPQARNFTPRTAPFTVSPWEIPGYFAMTPQEQSRARNALAAEKRRRLRDTGEIDVAPRYTAESPMRTFMNLDPLTRVQIQRDLAGVGLISGEYREGMFDSATADALTAAMSVANQQGTTWQQAIIDTGRQAIIDAQTGLEVGDEQDPPDPTFPELTYLAPDYATVAGEVRATFRRLLRRDPTNSELAGLADELSDHQRAAFDAQVEAQRGEFANSQVAAAGGDTTGGVVQAVDPAAQFDETFRARYQTAIATEEEEDLSGEAFGNLMQSLNVGRGVLGS